MSAVRWRRELHRIPETGLAEYRTSDYLAAELSAMGLPVTRGIGGTGVVATVHGAAGDRAVALRADMDGLPLAESADHPHRSQHDGVMHACGHDGHMAMLLGAGRVLAAEGGFAGAVHLVFQPAEEHGLGAKAMIADGLFDRFPAEAMFGLHNLPGLAAGRISTRVGGLMASEDNFTIRITGRGGHASQPQMVVDPIVVAAQVVFGLQTHGLLHPRVRADRQRSRRHRGGARRGPEDGPGRPRRPRLPGRAGERGLRRLR
jgi:amidohydrolase